MLSNILNAAVILSFAAICWLIFILLPQSIRKIVEKEVDRKSDIKLERVRADMQGAYATLNTSVDVLSNIHSEIRPYIIKTITNIWSDIVDIRAQLGSVVFFDQVILPSEAAVAFDNQDHTRPC